MSPLTNRSFLHPILGLLTLLISATPGFAGPVYKVRTEFLGTNEAVNAVAVDEANDRVYIGGSFTEAAGQPRQNLAAFSTVTGELLSWNPGCNGWVHSLAIDEGAVYIGGQFTEVASQPRKYAAKIDLGGNVQPWNPDPNAPVNSIAVTDFSVYLCGDFTMVGGLARVRFANANKTNGTPLLWNTSAAGGSPYAFAFSGATVYIGGGFSSVNGQARAGLAAVETNGLLLPWNPAVDDYIADLEVVGSTVYAGGGFTEVNGSARSNLAAIDTAGNLLPWAPSFDSSVSSLAFADNRLYVGGYFSVANSSPRTGLAAFDLEGNLLPWGPPADTYVLGMAVSKGTVFVCGDFENIGGITQRGFAAIYDPALLPKPRVTVRGKKRIETDRSAITLRGRSIESSRVEVKAKANKLHIANGVTTWTHRAKLRPGRNRIMVRSANLADATSDPVVIVAFRR